jgi:hypothetical protein
MPFAPCPPRFALLLDLRKTHTPRLMLRIAARSPVGTDYFDSQTERDSFSLNEKEQAPQTRLTAFSG